jgi:hypothetical protein
MTAEEIAARLGQAAPSGNWWCCMCPRCGKVNLCLRDNPSSRVKLSIKCWSGCDKTEIRKQIKRLHFLNGSGGNDEEHSETETARKAREAAEAVDHKRRVNEALDIWRNQSLPYKDAIGETYCCSRLLLEHLAALRFVPDLYHKLEKRKFPALIGLVEHQNEDAVGIHAIFLNALDPTSKLTIAERKLSYGPVGGGAIRLFPLDGDTLATAEGIEDAIAFYQAHKIPAWCTPTASGIKSFVPPPLSQIRRIILIEDQDPVDRRAVAEKAADLAYRGYSVQIARALVRKDPNAALLEIGLDKPVCEIEDYVLSPEFSDDYMALLFASRHRGDLRYVALWGKWLQWTQSYWRREETLKAYDLSRALCRETGTTAPLTKKAAANLTSSRTVAGIERMARSDRHHAATTDQWNPDDWLFNNPKKEQLNDTRPENRDYP